MQRWSWGARDGRKVTRKRDVNPAFASNSHTDAPRARPFSSSAPRGFKAVIGSLKPRQLLLCFYPFVHALVFHSVMWRDEFMSSITDGWGGLKVSLKRAQMCHINVEKRDERPASLKGGMVWMKKIFSMPEKKTWFIEVYSCWLSRFISITKNLEFVGFIITQVLQSLTQNNTTVQDRLMLNDAISLYTLFHKDVNESHMQFHLWCWLFTSTPHKCSLYRNSHKHIQIKNGIVIRIIPTRQPIVLCHKPHLPRAHLRRIEWDDMA